MTAITYGKGIYWITMLSAIFSDLYKKCVAFADNIRLLVWQIRDHFLKLSWAKTLMNVVLEKL